MINIKNGRKTIGKTNDFKGLNKVSKELGRYEINIDIKGLKGVKSVYNWTNYHQITITDKHGYTLYGHIFLNEEINQIFVVTKYDTKPFNTLENALNYFVEVFKQ